MLHRITSVFIVLIILLQPVAAFGREWGLPEAGEVSRSVFIRAMVGAFELPPSKKKDALPYLRVPKDIQGDVRILHDRGVLVVFNKDLSLASPVTRGQAVQMLVILSDLKQAGDGKTDFRDVRAGTPLARAVRVAIEQQWLVPLRATQFGVDKPLTASEAEKMLKKASGRAGQVRKDRSSDDTNMQVVRIQVPKKGNGAVVPKSDIMQAVWQIINDEYLYQEKVKQDDAAYAAIEGLVQSLGDPYTTFLRPVKAQNFRSQIKGEVTGIGAQVEDKSGILTIVTPLTGSPAERAGLLPGDEILAADGVSLTGIGFLEAVEHVRGPKGTNVKLRIRRAGSEFDVSVQRDVVTVPEVDVKFQDGVGIVKLMQFGQATDTKLRVEMQDLHKKNPRGIILDLRNNPGGLEHAAGVVVSNFVPKNTLVTIIKSNGASEEHRTEEEPTVDPAVPLVLLVNAGSASASEIVAGALQDIGRATLVGEKTFGKGTVQAVLQFSDLSSLKITVAQWLTPKGRAIDKIGITPDVVVPYSTERDEQMLKAMELLRR
jgi:carboxyl-terminal processing protease